MILIINKLYLNLIKINLIILTLRLILNDKNII